MHGDIFWSYEAINDRWRTERYPGPWKCRSTSKPFSLNAAAHYCDRSGEHVQMNAINKMRIFRLCSALLKVFDIRAQWTTSGEEYAMTIIQSIPMQGQQDLQNIPNSFPTLLTLIQLSVQPLEILPKQQGHDNCQTRSGDANGIRIRVRGSPWFRPHVAAEGLRSASLRPTVSLAQLTIQQHFQVARRH